MAKTLKNMSDGELESMGYKMFLSREQLISQLTQVNQNLQLIQIEEKTRTDSKQELVETPKIPSKPAKK